MPSFADLPRGRRSSTRWSTFLAQLQGRGPSSACSGGPRARRARSSEAQVRAMFDRIAGVYDLMNSVMTAGLHHRWRERAADLARARAGRPRARRRQPAPATWRIELARRVGPGRRGRSARTSPRRCSSARARKAPRADAGSGATRSSCPTPTARSTPRRSASARATSPTSTAGWPRWRASCARAAASSCSRSPRRASRRCRRSSRVWFDRVVPLHRAPRRRAGGLHLPAELGPALPRARGARGGDGSAPG